MYKQIILYVIILGLFLTGVKGDNMLQGGQEAIVDVNMDSVLESNITNVYMLNCNDGFQSGTKLKGRENINIRPGESKQMCVVLINKSSKDVNLKLSFVEGIKEKDGIVKCQNYKPQNVFEKIIKNSNPLNISVPKEANFAKYFNIKIPKNASGNIYGCVAYVEDVPLAFDSGQMFALQPRKASDITINITGSVYNFGRRDDIKNVYTTNKQIVLKILIAILAVRLIYTIVQTGKKKEKHTKK